LKSGKWFSGPAKIVVGLLVLALVAWNLPWRDVALLRTDGSTLSIPGEIVSNRGDSVDFRFDAAVQPDAAWPEAWRAARASGETVRLERDPERPGEGTFDWRPGVLSAVLGLDVLAIVGGLGAFVFGIWLTVVRWWWLLRAAGCGTRLYTVFRLTYLGLFFNLIVPGLTGGDLIKVVLAVREHPEKRADAFASAVVDRAVGVTGMLLVAGSIVVLAGENLSDLRVPVLLMAAAAFAGLFVLVHPAPRRLVRLDRWIHRLPLGKKLESLDRAARLYSGRPGTLIFGVSISAVDHACNALGVYVLARAMGSVLGFGDTLCTVSISSAISAIPLSPGGLGVEEAAYAWFFGLLGASAALGFAVGLTKRACFTLIGLAGGVFLLAPGGGRLKAEIAEARRQAA
jgi:hypothetical protein